MSSTKSHKVVLVIQEVRAIISSHTDGLAWDWVNSKLYWTDAEDKDIEVLDPQSGQRKLLVSTGNTSTPRAIVVDPRNK